jgi:carbon-monoxide dehydrogenase medium subunit
MYDSSTMRAPSHRRRCRRALAKAGDGQARAGGMTLIPTLKQRLAAPERCDRPRRIAELKPASRSRAAHRHRRDDAARRGRRLGPEREEQPFRRWRAWPASIGDPQVRNRGTIGGSLANNDPAADYPAAVLALGATSSPTSGRIAADDFFKGMFETALGEGEIITAIASPRPDQGRLHEVPEPGLALCHGRRVRRPDGGRCARRGDRRRARRVPREGDGSRRCPRTSRRTPSRTSRCRPTALTATSTAAPNTARTWSG